MTNINFHDQLLANHERHPSYESEGDDVQPPASPAVQLIAFHLPQFHPIPENDEWWGKGFTEWTNVSKAIPHFPGHYQPHLPADLGFYDLRLPDTLRAQARLARRYGISAFCFHWYWFSGTKLLDTPLNLLLSLPDIDLPFFVNWANENWTRRWDGKEQSVLMAQNYHPDDDVALADELIAIMRDPRYYRIGKRPLLMLYRPFLMPNPRESVARLRKRFAERGEEDPYILMDHAEDKYDPRAYGIEAAVQFPPHNKGSDSDRIVERHAYDKKFNGRVFSYDKLAEDMLTIAERDPSLMRGVAPSWDSTARRPNDGVIFFGSTPGKYGRWLAETAQRTVETRPPAERLVFINAWNEWAEGAHLEPDRHFGHAYLRETARALCAVGNRSAVEAYKAGIVEKSVADEMWASPFESFLIRARRKILRTLRSARS